jgi:hypothetical protein
LTEMPKTNDGEKSASSRNVAWENGYPPEEN